MRVQLNTNGLSKSSNPCACEGIGIFFVFNFTVFTLTVASDKEITIDFCFFVYFTRAKTEEVEQVCTLPYRLKSILRKAEEKL